MKDPSSQKSLKKEGVYHVLVYIDGGKHRGWSVNREKIGMEVPNKIQPNSSSTSSTSSETTQDANESRSGNYGTPIESIQYLHDPKFSHEQTDSLSSGNGLGISEIGNSKGISMIFPRISKSRDYDFFFDEDDYSMATSIENFEQTEMHIEKDGTITFAFQEVNDMILD